MQRLDEDPQSVARLGHALRSAGGVAIRMEASGAASDWVTWLDRLEAGVPGAVYSAAVLIVRDQDETVYTSGMHQFDLPDAEIRTSDLSEAIAWLDTFCTFQIAEQPVLWSGHTFRPYEGASRRTMERWPDHRHPQSDGRYNPFGVWKLVPNAQSRLRASEKVPVNMPSLVATLLAKESQQGRALTRTEVQKLVAQSPGIAMEVAHAREMERSRGYADIEPELAWEQWQLVTATP